MHAAPNHRTHTAQWVQPQINLPASSHRYTIHGAARYIKQCPRSPIKSARRTVIPPHRVPDQSTPARKHAAQPDRASRRPWPPAHDTGSRPRARPAAAAPKAALRAGPRPADVALSPALCPFASCHLRERRAGRLAARDAPAEDSKKRNLATVIAKCERLEHQQPIQHNIPSDRLHIARLDRRLSPIAPMRTRRFPGDARRRPTPPRLLGAT